MTSSVDNQKAIEVAQQIIKIGRVLGEKNYTPGYSGNISARIDNNILITVSGSANGHLKDSDFALMDFEGNSLIPNKRPSSEKKLHIEFYNQRPDINFIIHVHSPYLSTFASARKDLLAPIMAENVYYFKGIPLAEYGLPSSDVLVDNTAKFFKEYDCILMANHGVIIGSKTLKDAYLKLELAEQYAQVVLNTYLLGGPKPLSDKEAQDILALRELK